MKRILIRIACWMAAIVLFAVVFVVWGIVGGVKMIRGVSAALKDDPGLEAFADAHGVHCDDVEVSPDGMGYTIKPGARPQPRGYDDGREAPR